MGTDSVKHRETAKFEQLANLLQQKITEGHWQVGDKLPSIRQLARDFSLAKNTVISALQLLESHAWITAIPKSGFVVQRRVDFIPPQTPLFEAIKPSKVDVPELLQDVIARGAAFDIKPSEPLETEHSTVIKLHRAINRHMRTQSTRKSLYYGDPLGLDELRAQIALHYARLGTASSASELSITAGCQHGLLLALMATCSPGDNVMIESPGFYGVIQLLNELGLHSVEVPCHSISGIDLDKAEYVLSKYNIKACVVTPAFSTPTGACMPDEHKQRLVALANQYDFAVIEDDIYGDLGFDFRPTPIKAFDTENRVILCSSFSKSTSRDLRIGWIMAGRWQKRVQRLKLVSHLAGNQAIQEGLNEYIASGDFLRYLRIRAQQLKQQRDALVNVLVHLWPEDVRFTHPQGGLSLWLELPAHVDTLALYQTALKHHIVLTPGNLFSSQNDFSRFLRLSFCHPMTSGRIAAIQYLKGLCDNP